MKTPVLISGLIALASLVSCGGKPKLEISLSDKFEGRELQLVNFVDSTVLSTVTVENGKAVIEVPDSAPVFTALTIDGRTRAFYIPESGVAQINDSTNAATGTPLNDRFAALLARLDSIEDLDDTPAYMDFALKAYNDNKDNQLGLYFGMEWIRYATSAQIDSIMDSLPQPLRTSPKTAGYLAFARLRDLTAPGQPFADLEGEDADGRKLLLSQLVKPGQYTLVDFWASWCPYCIKELPEMKALYERFQPLGLEIVGVAVRDTPDDTKASVAKHSLPWPVVFNTQRRPYDIYGFSGIPHHLLIGPDGTIVARGENVAQLEARLQQTMGLAED